MSKNILTAIEELCNHWDGTPEDALEILNFIKSTISQNNLPKGLEKYLFVREQMTFKKQISIKIKNKIKQDF